MVSIVEREQPLTGQTEQVVQETPEQVEISPEVERGGYAQQVPTQVTAQVTDDQGQPLIQTPQTQQVTVTIPAEEKRLEELSKGSPDESLTWWARFWVRYIKKALHFGWRIITGQDPQSVAK